LAAIIISGIYVIRNTISGRVYVGSAVNIANRWLHHRKSLRAGKHHSPYLQFAWNKYGEDAFIHETIELVPDVTMLIEREQHWIDTHVALYGKGYNVCPTAGNTLGFKFSPESLAKIKAYRNLPEVRAANSARQLGRRVPEEAKAERYAWMRTPEGKTTMRLAQLGRKMTPEAIEANRRGQTGRKHSEETKEKMRLSSLGQTHSEESKRRISAAKRGKPLNITAEKRAIKAAKLSVALKGRTFSDKRKANISASKLGKKLGPRKVHAQLTMTL